MPGTDAKSQFAPYAPLSRVGAWTTLLTAYVAGTAAQTFGYLLTVAPRSIHNPNFTIDDIVRGVSIACLGLSLLLLRRYWKFPNTTASTFVQFFGTLSVLQFTVAGFSLFVGILEI